VTNPLARETAPEFQAVLDALDDPDCRTILRRLDEPLSADEVAETTGIPRSTAYRKLDRLHEAKLVAESTEIRRDGSHTARYERSFSEVRIALDEDRTFRAWVERSGRAPDERLADMWAEVRKET
jgi:DNA-binding transcriptional ArsR family regulator